MGEEVFKTELNRIKNEDIRISTRRVLNRLPDYFYHTESGPVDNHPDYVAGDGGLVRHIKVAARILEEMFRDSAFGTFDDDTKDLMRMAIILHDGFKFGYVSHEGHACPEHPVIMSNYILRNRKELGLPIKSAMTVARLIIRHMGPWNKNAAGEEIMPVPYEDDEKVVHLCDYIASRSFLEVKFDGNELAKKGVTNAPMKKIEHK